MEKKGARRHELLERLEEAGGLRPGLAREISAETGVPEADVYGVATFYGLIARPGARICQGLSCRLARADTPEDIEAVSCLGQCDRAPVALDGDMGVLGGERGVVLPDDPDLPINLGGEDDRSFARLTAARAMGRDAFFAELEVSGLQGRGGAGFPASIKWDAVFREGAATKHVVVNADEGEPGTFKDREVMLRRPHRLIEGMAIAAWFVGADTAHVYIRGEFHQPRLQLERALAEAKPRLGSLDVRVVTGHGAYICGEETALLEAMEGRRGMPRLKPPYPTEAGLFGLPTLINNVENLACVPSIVERGGAWFRERGRTEPGTKLYCISGHVQTPGVYELPLGSTMNELVAAAGGPLGAPRAFSPGGASSGFLPMSMADVPLDFKGLVEVGSMLGSAGAVLLNDTVDMARAARWQQVFFEDETCGQCAPCRIGCSLQRSAIDRFLASRDPATLEHVEEVHWEMEEGSICGLGMVASLPLVSAMKHFPEDFGSS